MPNNLIAIQKSAAFLKETTPFLIDTNTEEEYL